MDGGKSLLQLSVEDRDGQLILKFGDFDGKKERKIVDEVVASGWQGPHIWEQNQAFLLRTQCPRYVKSPVNASQIKKLFIFHAIYEKKNSHLPQLLPLSYTHPAPLPTYRTIHLRTPHPPPKPHSLNQQHQNTHTHPTPHALAPLPVHRSPPSRASGAQKNPQQRRRDAQGQHER